MSDELTHISADGTANMVDVGAKPPLAREAVATGTIALAAETLTRIRENALKKGDVLAVARIAGIQAAKQTQLLIPLCHQIPLTKVAVEFTFEPGAVRATTTAKTVARTGVEMEALTAASIALLTIYDMCKAVDKTMRIDAVQLLSKTKSAL